MSLKISHYDWYLKYLVYQKNKSVYYPWMITRHDKIWELFVKKNVIAKVLFNTNFLITPMNITLKW